MLSVSSRVFVFVPPPYHPILGSCSFLVSRGIPNDFAVVNARQSWILGLSVNALWTPNGRGGLKICLLWICRCGFTACFPPQTTCYYSMLHDWYSAADAARWNRRLLCWLYSETRLCIRHSFPTPTAAYGFLAAGILVFSSIRT